MAAQRASGLALKREEEIDRWRGNMMELRERLLKVDGQSKLLIRSLVSGPFGAHNALRVFQRQQRANPGVSILNLIKTLCRDEVTSETATQPITM